ncbi:hypothetical protein [Burkholderia pseudomultivorans]|uniref:Uncharacterized protein n=1 Tax=Burkholderia pseudomultivorans TaxID=1207504 RepID=A0A132EHE9_9BURK|nr:hypothetical protein [Burkholderia pseudomultivorans]KWF29875.1 hypothetical protein WT56_15940 [Burkholderia pseudomultivorans]
MKITDDMLTDEEITAIADRYASYNQTWYRFGEKRLVAFARALLAGRRTTPDREAITHLKECADEVMLANATGNEELFLGAIVKLIASINRLQTAPTSDKGGA